MLGHVTSQMGKRTEAVVHYLHGARPLPNDADLRDLLRMSYLRRGTPSQAPE